MLYLLSEIFYTELEELAYFNDTVTFPFLHCVEKGSQEELLKILPKLYQDLDLDLACFKMLSYSKKMNFI